MDRTLLDSAALCRHLLGEGSVHAFLAEHRSAVFPDEMFEDLPGPRAAERYRRVKPSENAGTLERVGGPRS